MPTGRTLLATSRSAADETTGERLTALVDHLMAQAAARAQVDIDVAMMVTDAVDAAQRDERVEADEVCLQLRHHAGLYHADGMASLCEMGLRSRRDVKRTIDSLVEVGLLHARFVEGCWDGAEYEPSRVPPSLPAEMAGTVTIANPSSADCRTLRLLCRVGGAVALATGVLVSGNAAILDVGRAHHDWLAITLCIYVIPGILLFLAAAGVRRGSPGAAAVALVIAVGLGILWLAGWLAIATEFVKLEYPLFGLAIAINTAQVILMAALGCYAARVMRAPTVCVRVEPRQPVV